VRTATLRLLPLAVAGALAALALVSVLKPTSARPAAGAGHSSSALTVFAASSLTEALPSIDGRPRYSFAGSNALAAQLESGARADVFASADMSIPARLHARGFLERPVRFARNRLVLVVPRSNPAGVGSIRDLAKPGVTIDVAAPSVPVGGYTLEAIERTGLASRILRNVVSRERDVRGVLAKVALGQADAGFVYSSDARTVPGQVRVIALPASLQPTVAYAIAVVAGTPNREAARAYVTRLLGASAQARLAAHGFVPVLSTAGVRELAGR
jgi:molybdate transport system substrate-binding protein